MGRWQFSAFGRTANFGTQPTPDLTPQPSETFAVDAQSIDPAVFGLASYTSPTAPVARIDRVSAIQVPAVKRVRDLICGALGALPLDLIGPDKQPGENLLFSQPEKNTPRSVTMTKTFEDLLFEGVAWWHILEFGWHTYPTKIRRLDPRVVEVRQDGTVYVNGKHVPDSDLIRFDSPNDALLIAGARAIRTALHLDEAARRYSETPMPQGVLSITGVFEDETDVQETANTWELARRNSGTAVLPEGMTFTPVQFNPKDLQLADARQHAVLEIARLTGVDPSDLGVSVDNDTYQNVQDRRKAFLDFVAGGYRQAVEDRLSMGDITPRGYFAKFNLSSFLRSDDLTRMQTYAIAKSVGALTGDEIRALEDRPALPASEQPQAIPAAPEPVSASLTLSADADAVSFDASNESFSVDVEKRVIRGVAVPYDKSATKNGYKFQFSKGSLSYADISRVKLWINHDQTQAVGVAFELDDRDDGLYAAFRVARGPEGDRALSLAEDGVLDGLSVGAYDLKATAKAGVMHVSSAHLREISLTAIPAFDDARITSVAASADLEGITIMTEPIVEPKPVPVPVVDFSGVTDAIRAGFDGLSMPQRETVSAGAPLLVDPKELPYRFDGQDAKHSFTADLRSMANGDQSAKERLDTFMEEAFAVTTGNVSTLNPTQNRPELYVPNLEFTRPLWSLVSNGVVNDVTPFTIPKFSAAAGLVGAHTQGVEPTPGSFSATNQTVTPTPVSGKIEINREVWDQGGNPKADAIIWREMVNGYYEAIEVKIATMLNALSLTEINLAGATNAALLTAVENIFLDLQFVRGGNRYTAFASDAALFKALAGAADTTGRPLLPITAPTNADGQLGGTFSQISLGAQNVVASWALNAGAGTNASNSYLFVPSSVWAWASAPKQFTFEYQVKSIDMAVWGYTASAVLRDTDVKRVDYTTADV